MSGPSAARAERRRRSVRSRCSTRPRLPAESQGAAMAKSKNEKPSVATYADHEVITPPHELRKAASTVASNAFAEQAVARAEQALADLSGEFGRWMEEECKRIDAARGAIKAKGFGKATREALF